MENAWRARLRTTLTLIGVAIASGALVSMIGFILGLREQVETPINQLGLLSNIEVRPISNPQETTKSPPLNKAMLKQIEAIDGVDVAYPDFRLSKIELTYGEVTKETLAFGLPRETGMLSMSRDLLVAGDFFTLGGGNEVVLGMNLLEQLGFDSPAAAVGQTVQFAAGGLVQQEGEAFVYEDEQLQLTIVGVFDPPGFATSLNGDAILLPVDIMTKMPSSWMEEGLNQLRTRDGRVQHGYSRVIVRADSPTTVTRVQKKLEAMGYHTLSVMDRMQDIRKFFVFMEALLAAVGTVALVVAGIGILNTLTMTVMERYQEIGIYKSIGASNGDIRWMFLVEAAVVGLLGGVGGLLLAGVVSKILKWAFTHYADMNGVDGPEAVFIFPVWLLCGGVVYSIVVSVVSGIYPASRAANVDPIDALRRGS